MSIKKGLLATSILLASGITHASNWIIIKVGDISTLIPNPQVEDLLVDKPQSGTELTVNLGSAASTEGFYYQRVEVINGVEVNHGWACQTGISVAANGNKLIEKNDFSGEFYYNVVACMDKGPSGQSCDVNAFENGLLNLCSDQAQTDNFIFNGIASTGTVSPDPDLTVTETHVGLTGGSFRVTESGAATYDIPISVPNGTAGVQPQLSLSYSSQGGDGYVGRGWNISGTSAISRCPKTIAQDGEIGGVTGTISDRLCFNGQRLRVANETRSIVDDETYWEAVRYVLEIDNFSSFHRDPASNSIVMETKSGEFHYFGDVNSFGENYEYCEMDEGELSCEDRNFHSYQPIKLATQQFQTMEGDTDSSDGYTTTGSYLLKAIRDVKHNYIYYVYDSEEHYLKEVHYTGNYKQDLTPYAKVVFRYEDNKKPTVGYFRGEPIKMTKLLDNIQVYIDGESYRYYGLEYFTSVYADEKNYLTSVTECIRPPTTFDWTGSNNAFDWDNTCNEPLSFEWQKPDPIKSNVAPGDLCIAPFCVPGVEAFSAFSYTETHSIDAELGGRFMDITGDGYADYVYVKDEKWKVKTGPSFSTESTLLDGRTDSANRALNIDFDGDGIRDLLVANSTGDKWHAVMYATKERTYDKEICENGDCYFKEITATTNVIPTSITASSIEGRTSIVDINGDGLEDLMVAKNDGVYVRKNIGNGFEKTETKVVYLASNETIAGIATNSDNKSAHLINMSAVDVNGDGVTDLALNISSSYPVCEFGRLPSLDTGDGLLSTDDNNPGMIYDKKPDVAIADCTNENAVAKSYILARVVTEYKNSWEMFTGNGKDRFVKNTNFNPTSTFNPQFADLNGDGLTDIVFKKSGSWHYKLSTGVEFASADGIDSGVSVSSDYDDQFRLVDLNQDGRADMFSPTGSNTYKLYLSVADKTLPSEVKFIPRGNYLPSHGEQDGVPNQIAEFNGDSHLDFARLQDDQWHIHLGSSEGQPRHVINKITNGNGVSTDIEYASLMSSAVYTSRVTPYASASAHTKTPDAVKDTDFISPKGGMFVVGAVNSDVNTGSQARVEYRYSGLLMNKVGRGYLGFHKLQTIDPSTCEIERSRVPIQMTPYGVITQGAGYYATSNKCMVTTTEYSQEYPFVGMPVRTSQHYGTILLSDAENNLEHQVSAEKALYPYIENSVEHKYSLSNDFQTRYHISSTKSEFDYDAYGNLDTSTVTVTDETADFDSGANRLVTSTVNNYITYNDSGSQLWSPKAKGRLRATTTTKSRYESGKAVKTTSRTSNFSYYPFNDDDNRLLLHTEVVSPNDDSFKTTKTYTYDEFGNKNSITLTSPDLEGSRVTIDIYDDRGRLPISTTSKHISSAVNSEGQHAENVYAFTSYKYDDKGSDNRGLVLEVKTSDINGFSNIKVYDDWGQITETRSFGSDGADLNVDVRTYSGYCTAQPEPAEDQPSCPNDAVYLQGTFSLGGGESVTYFDAWGREVLKASHTISGWSYVESEYNNQGLIERVSEPYFTAPLYWSSQVYDKLRRTTQTTAATGMIVDYDFEGRVSTTTTTISSDEAIAPQEMSKTHNYAGELVTATDHDNKSLVYSYDAFGNLSSVLVDGTEQVSTVYDDYGNKLSTTDLDKGTWSYEYNAFGQLEYQQDAELQEVNFYFDSLGRKERRTEAEGTTCWYYGTSQPEIGNLIEVRQYDTIRSCPNLTSNDTSYYYKESYTYGTNGKTQSKTVQFDGEIHTSFNFYDDYQRVLGTYYPGQSKMLRYEYELGMNTKIYATGDATKPLKEITEVSARGQAMNIGYANGMSESRTFHDDSGLAYLFEVFSNDEQWHNNQTYYFNYAGTLEQRDLDLKTNGEIQSFNEHFRYDDLNRVRSRTITGSGFHGHSASETFDYDAYGNLTQKTGVDSFNYTDNERPNRLKSASGGYVFEYDKNGNIESDGKRTIVYSSFDKPTSITKVTSSGEDKVITRFEYGPNREVLKRVDERGSKTTTTYYLGGYEKVVTSENVTEHKIYAANTVLIKRSDATSDTYFLHKDYLGSTVAVSDANGNEVEQFMYDTFGKQRRVYAVNSNLLPVSPAISRGYTGHIMVNDIDEDEDKDYELDIIHMNGRIYDPTLGRFLQADPHIQAPTNMQNYNRYSYVINNPMSYTDPSGYFFKALHRFVKKYWKPIVAAIASYYTFGAASAYFGSAIAGGATAGFVGGAISTGSLRGALTGAVTGAIFAGIGSAFDASSGFFAEGGLGHIFSHGLTGGILSDLQGGNFGHGFWSAGLTKAANVNGMVGTTQGVGWDTLRIVVAAAVGGTISKITGGKFGNGAVTAAMGQMLNGNSAAKRIEQRKAAAARAAARYQREAGKIYVTGHRVSGTAIHLAIEYTGENGTEWISAGPEGMTIEGAESLVSGQTAERPTDMPSKNFTVGEVTAPDGMTNAEYFNALKSLDLSYCDCVDYDLFPGMMDSYNSNSFVSGLIQATGGTSTVDLDFYYGGGKPLPSKYFGL